MPLSTTVIGSFPKPAFLKMPDWFKPIHVKSFTLDYNRFVAENDKHQIEELIVRAIKETIQTQAEAGIDVITDGEVRRESYILHFCRALRGFDFDHLVTKTCRDGATTMEVPRIVSEVLPRESEPWVWKEWKISQGLSRLPMKITLPGPMTIINSVEDQYYKDDNMLGSVLAKILNTEIKALASAGCRYVQVGVPVQ